MWVIAKADFQVNGGNLKWMDGMWITVMKVSLLLTWESDSEFS